MVDTDDTFRHVRKKYYHSTNREVDILSDLDPKI